MEERVVASKPKWLRKLERESWQAELIISGVAILGSLQLIGLLDDAQHYLLLNYDRAALKLWFLAVTYWVFFAYGLAFLFIFHFAVRALWIGLIGLNSVYPDGIVKSTMWSQDFFEKTRAAYGDVDGFIRELDRSASGLFGKGFTFAGLMLNLGVFLSVVLIMIGILTDLGVNSTLAWVICLLPAVLVLLGSVVSSLFMLPGLRERAWVQRYHFPLTKLASYLTYPINRRYTVLGLSLMGSQSTIESKSTAKVIAGAVAGFLVLFVIGLLIGFTGTIKPAFIDEVYHRLGDTPSSIDHNNYAEPLPEDLLYEPVTASLYLQPSDPFWVWVPVPEREAEELEAICDLPEADEDLPRVERRKIDRKRILTCADDYVSIYLDGTKLTDLDPVREYLKTVGFEQYGIRYDLGTASALSPGRHELRVETKYYPAGDDDAPDTTRPRVTYMPVYLIGPAGAREKS